MSVQASEYRLDGIYRQRQDGFFMQRVKLAAGVISAAQARTVADIAERFGRGTIHLTSRGSMEIHWLAEHGSRSALGPVKRDEANTRWDLDYFASGDCLGYCASFVRLF